GQDIVGAWGRRKVAEIGRRDAEQLIERVRAERGTWAARHVLAHGRKLFKWLSNRERFGVARSPFEALGDNETLGLSAQAKRRGRVLNDDEMCRVWRATFDRTVCPAYGGLVRCLALSPQRVRDFAGARHTDIVKNHAGFFLVVPPERFKSDRPHEI